MTPEFEHYVTVITEPRGFGGTIGGVLDTKYCNRCGDSKTVDLFHKSKTGKYGVKSTCKVCVASYGKERYEKYKESISIKAKKYREDNRELILKRKALYREQNKDKINDYAKSYRVKNRDAINQKLRVDAHKNPEKYRNRRRRYVEKNRVRVRSLDRAKKLRRMKRTPAWADIDHIHEFYEARECIQNATGECYHVDHIIPLQGEFVSGLHVPGNLQIIRAKRNLKKHNSYKVT